MRVFAVLCTLLLGATLSCAHFPLGMRAIGTIRGLVVTEPDFEPVSGATVVLARRRGGVTTANDGTFQFTNVPVGDHTISVHMGSVIGATTNGVPVTRGDSTCVLVFSPPPRAGSPVDRTVTVPETEPLLVLNGVVRFYSSDVSAASVAGQPPRVIQIRNPWGHVNIASVENMRADSAMQMYGRRASLGALLINTRPHAPCTSAGG